MEHLKRKSKKAHHPSPESDRGFTLIELLIAMAVGLVLLGAMYGVFTMHNKTFGTQEQIAEMQQNARAAMDMMTREIRMAGYNPAGIAFDGITYSASQLQVKADLDGNGTIAGQENIIYKYDSANYQVTRNIGSGDQPLIENVQTFTFDYLDSAGNSTTTTANIRQIRITITARTSEPDPDYAPNSGYRTYTLTSVITPRNLGL
ncbi:MAG: prepilin-type N-terminal cleavage/methylation domain-containing protein [Deltaproteobacteria bacterium]|nr:prepilin-type N-terminal cleavage/methylation domain-containing protein [Deltaproteobacteria bacterium]